MNFCLGQTGIHAGKAVGLNPLEGTQIFKNGQAGVSYSAKGGSDGTPINLFTILCY